MTAWQDAAASGEPSVPAAWASASISSCVKMQGATRE